MKFFKMLKEDMLVFPKKIKFKVGLWWYLEALIKPHTKRGRRKYCSECGWKLVYYDELYDVDPEAILPNVVAECSFCGTEFEEVKYYSFGEKKAVLPVMK